MIQNKKNLTVFLGVILALIIGFFVVQKLEKLNIRSTVLSKLEEQLEFCEVIKEEISKENSSFWMICNQRPFFVEYKDEELIIKKNGWSFIEEDKALSEELADCDFYDSRDSELIFYCPKDFSDASMVAKVYEFHQEEFLLQKKEEKSFLNVISKDIQRAYMSLSDCEVEGFKSFRYSAEYPPVMSVYFYCELGEEDEEYVVHTDLATVPIQPPILTRTVDLSYEEIARKSFEKAFELNIDQIEVINDSVFIKSGNFRATYVLPENERPMFYYSINNLEKKENSIDVLKEFGNKFLLRSGVNNAKRVGETDKNIVVYQTDNGVVLINYLSNTGSIDAFWEKTSSFNK